jgi:hypothetical protein
MFVTMSLYFKQCWLMKSSPSSHADAATLWIKVSPSRVITPSKSGGSEVIIDTDADLQGGGGGGGGGGATGRARECR